MNRFIGVMTAILLWFLVTQLELVSPLFVPKIPVVIVALINEVKNQNILDHFFATLWRVLVAFTIATIMGISLGLVLGYIKKIYQSCEILIDFVRSLPGFVLFPLFLVVFGLGDPAKIALSVWVGTLSITINTIYSVRSCRELRLLAAKAMKIGTWQLLFKVILPEAAPNVVAGLRVGISLVLISMVASEMFTGTTYGLGQYIYNASIVYNTPQMYAGILLAGSFGYLLNKLFQEIETRLIHWRGR